MTRKIVEAFRDRGRVQQKSWRLLASTPKVRMACLISNEITIFVCRGALRTLC